MDKGLDKELNLDDLENVTGGRLFSSSKVSNTKTQLMKISCPICCEVFQADVMKSQAVCPECSHKISLKG